MMSYFCTTAFGHHTSQLPTNHIIYWITVWSQYRPGSLFPAHVLTAGIRAVPVLLVHPVYFRTLGSIKLVRKRLVGSRLVR